MPTVHTLNAAPVRSADDRMGENRKLVVNRATCSDANVVISFNHERDENGHQERDAIGLAPEEARDLAIRLLAAADVVAGYKCGR